MLDDFESFLINVEEVNESLLVVHDYLNCVPTLDNVNSYYDLVTQHCQHFAVLNLAIHRLDGLIEKNRQIFEKHMKELRKTP